MDDHQLNTIDFVLSEITTSIDKQMSWVDGIDRKAVTLLTLGSALVTVLPTVASGLDDSGLSWRLTTLAVPGAIYLAAMAFLWDAFRPRTWGIVPDPPLLKEHWLTSSVEEVQQVIIEAIANAYESNQRQIDSKGRSLAFAAALVAIEAAALVISLAVIAY